MKRSVAVLSMILCCMLSLKVLAADKPVVMGNVEEGKIKSALCAGCHGLQGEGKVMPEGQPDAPVLAGQIPGYFLKAMQDYKTDKRVDPLMNAISKGLTDADVANLAAFYASIGAK